MIRVKKQDSVLKVSKKISASSSKEVFIDFPIGHSILSDYSSLRILQKSHPEKKLVIITKDLSAKKLLTKLGFSFTIVKDEEYLKKAIEHKDILLKHNTSFFEYFLHEIRKNWKDIRGKITKKKDEQYSKTFPFLIILSTLVLSVSLLMFIFYFAVHKTTIEITPNIEVLKVQKNFVFNNLDEISLNNNTIGLRKISLQSSVEESFSSTNIEYSSSKQASGEVILLSELNVPQKLVRNTRLLSNDGIIYRLQNDVEVPASNIAANGKKSLGTITVTVEADPFDINGNFTGSRGNSKAGEALTVPGLTGDFANKIYAESKKLQGGEDSYDVVVGEDDLEKASELLEIKLQNKALQDLSINIAEQNNELNGNYELLTAGDSIYYSDFEFINMDNISVGDKKKNFRLAGTITITAYVYNTESILIRLKNMVNSRVIDENQKIMYIDDSSLRVAHILYDRSNKEEINIKATMEIEAFVSKNFNNDTFQTQILKNKIAGLEKKEAYDVLLNTPNINNIHIKNTPFFINTVSSKPENIFFKRKE